MNSRPPLAAALLALQLVIAPSRVSAQDEEPRTITLEEALRIALERNVDLRLARNAEATDAVAVQQQKMQFLPDVRFSTGTAQSYGRNFSATEGRVIDETSQSVNTGVSSSVVLFNGLANVASLRQAQLARDASRLDVNRAGQTVVFTVVSNYLALIEQQEQVRVARENLAAQKAQEREVAAYVDAGARTIADLYQQQASVAGAQLALVEAERARDLAELDVMQTLQLDPGGEYEFEAPELAVDASPAAGQYDLDSLMTRAFEQRADLTSQETRQRAAEQAVRAAKAGSWPTISLGAGYSTAYTSAVESGFWDQLDQRRGGSVALGLELPVFDRGSVRLTTARARIEEEDARIAVEARRHEIGLQVRRAYLDYVAAREQLAAAEAQLRAAELAVETSEERYEVGAATLVELTQARAVQVQAASALVTARYNLLFQRTLIDYYSGGLDPARLVVVP